MDKIKDKDNIANGLDLNKAKESDVEHVPDEASSSNEEPSIVLDDKNLDNKLQGDAPKDHVSESSAEMISALQEEIADLHDKLLRSFAEAENIRHRSTKMVEEARLYSISHFAKDLLPVLDNFSRTIDHAPKNAEGELQVIIDGVLMTKSELENVFAKYGLECVSPKKGEKFDYNKHNAISQVVTDGCQSGTIVDTMQVGYKINDRLLRPAIVTVAK